MEHWQGREISISSSRKQVIRCDDEVLEKISVSIKVISRAIKALIPKKKGYGIE